MSPPQQGPANLTACAGAGRCLLTSIHEIGPVDDSEPLEDPVQGVLGERGPGNGDAFR